MEYQSLIVTHLHRIWDEQVASGYITYDEMHDSLLDQVTGSMDISGDEMHDSLLDQVTGSMDISGDELDAPIARLLGWDIENITEDQWNIWKNLVNMAATEYISR